MNYTYVTHIKKERYICIVAQWSDTAGRILLSQKAQKKNIYIYILTLHEFIIYTTSYIPFIPLCRSKFP